MDLFFRIVDLFFEIVDLFFERAVCPNLLNSPGYRPATQYYQISFFPISAHEPPFQFNNSQITGTSTCQCSFWYIFFTHTESYYSYNYMPLANQSVASPINHKLGCGTTPHNLVLNNKFSLHNYTAKICSVHVNCFVVNNDINYYRNFLILNYSL